MDCEHKATKEVCCDCGKDLAFDGPAELRRQLSRFAEENFDLHAVVMFVKQHLTKWYQHDESHHHVIALMQRTINDHQETITALEEERDELNARGERAMKSALEWEKRANEALSTLNIFRGGG